MPSLDEIFAKEFKKMMSTLKGSYGYMDLGDIPLPQECANRWFVEKHKKVFIGDIHEEYYEKLAGTEALLWGSSQLKRRKFDYRGEFIIDKNGNYKIEDVTCPHNCVGVVSDISIGVPAKFKSKEGFQYVDMISKTSSSGREMHKFVYIIPKKYCYNLNQTALVMSWNKLRAYYSGVALSLQNGHVLYVYIIPYKPTSQQHNYRVICTKTSMDYEEDLEILKRYWVSRNMMFNPDDCELYDYVGGRENMAVLRLDGVIDDYERFDVSKTLNDGDEYEDIDFEGI